MEVIRDGLILLAAGEIHGLLKPPDESRNKGVFGGPVGPRSHSSAAVDTGARAPQGPLKSSLAPPLIAVCFGSKCLNI